MLESYLGWSLRFNGLTMPGDCYDPYAYVFNVKYLYVYVYVCRLGTIHGRLKESVHSDAIGEWRLTLTEDELQRLFAMAPLLRKLGYPQ